MNILIEEGESGLWYGITANPTGPYKGLLITGDTLDEVLDQISPTIKAMRDAAKAAARAAIAIRSTPEIEGKA